MKKWLSSLCMITIIICWWCNLAFAKKANPRIICMIKNYKEKCSSLQGQNILLKSCQYVPIKSGGLNLFHKYIKWPCFKFFIEWIENMCHFDYDSPFWCFCVLLLVFLNPWAAYCSFMVWKRTSSYLGRISTSDISW